MVSLTSDSQSSSLHFAMRSLPERYHFIDSDQRREQLPNPKLKITFNVYKKGTCFCKDRDRGSLEEKLIRKRTSQVQKWLREGSPCLSTGPSFLTWIAEWQALIYNLQIGRCLLGGRDHLLGEADLIWWQSLRGKNKGPKKRGSWTMQRKRIRPALHGRQSDASRVCPPTSHWGFEIAYPDFVGNFSVY